MSDDASEPLKLRFVVPPGVQAALDAKPAAPRRPPPIALVESHTGITHPVVDVTRLGREVDNHVVSASFDVSRHHAEVRLERGTWVVRDLGSSMGTLLNGKRIEQTTVIQPGDRIQLASWLLDVIAAPPVPTCPACDEARPQGAAFCGTCGARLG